MRRVLRWLKYLLLSLLALFVCAVGAVYGVSEYKLRRTHEVAPVTIKLPDDPAALTEGERLARLRGCYFGCHDDLGGSLFFDEPWLARLVAPNLTRAAARYSAEDIARIARFGIRPNGISTMGTPSDMFHYLTDEDLGKIIAFIKASPPIKRDLPKSRFRIMARVMIAFSQFPPDADRVAALGPRAPAPGPTPAYGRYLVTTICTECHGTRLEGESGGPAPPLSIAKTYSREAFGKLMRTGVPIGDRDLELMDDVARERFSQFTEEKVDAVYAFLQSTEIPLDRPGY